MSQQVEQIARLLEQPQGEAEANAAAEVAPVEQEQEEQAPIAEGDENSQDDKPIEGGEVGGEDEPEAAEAEEGESDEQADEGDVDTLNNLAEQLDVPVEDLYALNVKMTKGEALTLGGLKDFYEANQDVEGLRSDITEQREALTKQADAMNEIPQITNEYVQARADVISISDQYNRINWDQLRVQDGAQYAALKQDFESAWAAAKTKEQELEGKVKQHDTQQSEFQQDRLFKAIPELKDKAYRDKAAEAVSALTAKYGFSDTETAAISDSRLMHLLIDAAKGVQAVETVKAKQVEKAAPKGNKPTARKHVAQDAGRKATLKKLTEKAKASGLRVDQTNAVAALLNP